MTYKRLLFPFLVIFLAALPCAAETPSEPPSTVITSEQVEMFAGDSANRFEFAGDVTVRSTQLVARCDKMTVLASRLPSKSPSSDQADGEGEKIQEIIMQGSVVIEQEGRRAAAGKAEIYPDKGQVILSEKPVVTDGEGTITGWKMVLHKDRRRVEILSDPAEPASRTKIQLKALPNLGVPTQAEAQPQQTPTPAAAVPPKNPSTVTPPVPAAPANDPPTRFERPKSR